MPGAFSGAEGLDHNTSMFWLRLPLRRPPLPHTLCSRLTAPMWEAAAKTGDVPRMRLLQGNPSSPPPAVERLDLARCTATGHVGPMPHRWRLLLAGLFAVLALYSASAFFIFRVPERLEALLGGFLLFASILTAWNLYRWTTIPRHQVALAAPSVEAPANWCVASTPVVCSSACSAWGPRLGLGLG